MLVFCGIAILFGSLLHQRSKHGAGGCITPFLRDAFYARSLPVISRATLWTENAGPADSSGDRLGHYYCGTALLLSAIYYSALETRRDVLGGSNAEAGERVFRAAEPTAGMSLGNRGARPVIGSGRRRVVAGERGGRWRRAVGGRPPPEERLYMSPP
jgi:hypothetical protein